MLTPPHSSLLAPHTIACLLSAMLLVSGMGSATEIYKRTLPNGQVVYSDQPSSEAQRIELPPPQVVAPLQVPRTAARDQRTQPTEYSGVSITQPAPDAVIWNDQGDLSVTVQIEPPLQSAAGHRVAVLLDGKPAGEATTANRLELHNVFRGTHVIQAEVRDRSGAVLITSKPVTFHMKQHSILFPRAKQPTIPAPAPAP